MDVRRSLLHDRTSSARTASTKPMSASQATAPSGVIQPWFKAVPIVAISFLSRAQRSAAVRMADRRNCLNNACSSGVGSLFLMLLVFLTSDAAANGVGLVEQGEGRAPRRTTYWLKARALPATTVAPKLK